MQKFFDGSGNSKNFRNLGEYTPSIKRAELKAWWILFAFKVWKK
jgi:hypothetical protein